MAARVGLSGDETKSTGPVSVVGDDENAYRLSTDATFTDHKDRVRGDPLLI